ncbi:STAS/SEC14 domain-containing protein [Echinimonas agarilytica]|uniref:STAS/SEC14 domain-containing protein n=1 Tax=Echinimonas agarilytica TaxID=1215918 RepID=A0AA42B844_9GAMM|nr:STAS/SEC14 domain-containing protein [Echinimonas agarilytica]MCM2679901.1 STAS/SEC14 domain-containing protein [Echinimonas agarilytica]
MIIIRDDMPEGIVAMEGVGEITREDYQDIIRPELERSFAHGEKIRFFYILGSQFTGFEPGALIDDAKLGIKHLGDFERIAVVCDVKWVNKAVKLVSFATPSPLQTFAVEEFDQALAWLQQ